jgi:hypothetical protein
MMDRVHQVREMSDRDFQVHVDLEIIVDARPKEKESIEETLSGPVGGH